MTTHTPNSADTCKHRNVRLRKHTNTITHIHMVPCQRRQSCVDTCRHQYDWLSHNSGADTQHSSICVRCYKQLSYNRVHAPTHTHTQAGHHARTYARTRSHAHTRTQTHTRTDTHTDTFESTVKHHPRHQQSHHRHRRRQRVEPTRFNLSGTP